MLHVCICDTRNFGIAERENSTSLTVSMIREEFGAYPFQGSSLSEKVMAEETAIEQVYEDAIACLERVRLMHRFANPIEPIVEHFPEPDTKVWCAYWFTYEPKRFDEFRYHVLRQANFAIDQAYQGRGVRWALTEIEKAIADLGLPSIQWGASCEPTMHRLAFRMAKHYGELGRTCLSELLVETSKIDESVDPSLRELCPEVFQPDFILICDGTVLDDEKIRERLLAEKKAVSERYLASKAIATNSDGGQNETV